MGIEDETPYRKPQIAPSFIPALSFDKLRIVSVIEPKGGAFWYWGKNLWSLMGLKAVPARRSALRHAGVAPPYASLGLLRFHSFSDGERGTLRSVSSLPSPRLRTEDTLIRPRLIGGLFSLRGGGVKKECIRPCGKLLTKRV